MQGFREKGHPVSINVCINGSIIGIIIVNIMTGIKVSIQTNIVDSIMGSMEVSIIVSIKMSMVNSSPTLGGKVVFWFGNCLPLHIIFRMMIVSSPTTKYLQPHSTYHLAHIL